MDDADGSLEVSSKNGNVIKVVSVSNPCCAEGLVLFT